MTQTIKAQQQLSNVFRTTIAKPFERFIHNETSSGIMLLICAIIAIIWANTESISASYFHLWEQHLSIGIGDAVFSKTLHHWINDGLMVIFFFVVGLEIKREFLVSELSGAQKAALPIIAALGGMVVPALLYALLNGNGAASHGWGIPMATDIAFALGALGLLGKRVPFSLKVFLTALAIADDLGAVLVIAVFYTSDLHLVMLGYAAVFFLIALLGNLLDIRSVMFYLIIGILLWFCILNSGIHATIAGVLLAIAVPARQRINADDFADRARAYIDEFCRQTQESTSIMANQQAQSAVRDLEQACEYVQTPLSRFENGLHLWVAFLIMPIFAFANAGVVFSGNIASALTNTITLGIVLGLVVGKPLGITLFCFIAERLGWVRLPSGVAWKHIIAVGCFAGIGFTMSLFVQELAFDNLAFSNAAKIGILAASTLSIGIGYTIFLLFSRNDSPITND